MANVLGSPGNKRVGDTLGSKDNYHKDGIARSALWANSWGQKVVIFFKDSLTGAVFELEKCFFFK